MFQKKDREYLTHKADAGTEKAIKYIEKNVKEKHKRDND